MWGPFLIFIYPNWKVLELCQSAEWKLVSLNQEWLSPLLPPTSPLRSNLWKCTTSLSQKLSQETMLVSTLRTCLWRKFVVEMSVETARTIHPRLPRTSLRRYTKFIQKIFKLFIMIGAFNLLVSKVFWDVSCLNLFVGHHLEPPWWDQKWICTCPWLPYCSHCLQICWDQGEVRSS